VRGHFRTAEIDIGRLVAARLSMRAPGLLGPEADRSAFADENRDLFPKDEFLVYGAGR
jgi:hypothetical protein